MIYVMHPSAVMKHWSEVSRALEPAFEHSEQEAAADHLPLLLRDQEQLWHIHGRAWAITRVTEGKRGRCFVFAALAGEGMPEWLAEFVPLAEDWARERGCTRALVYGRRGWSRVLPAYELTHVTLSREL